MRAATIAAFILSLVIQVGFPLAVTLYFRRHSRAPWKIYGYGMMVFALFQMVTWLPLSVYLDATLGAKLVTETGAFLWLLAMALVTSLVEEGGRWLGYRYLFPRHKYTVSWENGIMYGLGHASMETMLFIAGLTFVYFIAYLVLGQVSQGTLFKSLAPVQAVELSAAYTEIISTTWTQPIIVAIERVLMFGHQLAWSVMVLVSLIARRKRWFLFAVVYHLTVAVVVPGLARLSGFAIAEVVNLLFFAFSISIIIKLRQLLAEEHLV